MGVAKKEDIQIEEYEYLRDNKSFHKIGDMSHVTWGGSDTCQAGIEWDIAIVIRSIMITINRETLAAHFTSLISQRQS